MWEAVAFSGRAATEEERAHACGLADADRADGGGYVGHRVVDCEACHIALLVIALARVCMYVRRWKGAKVRYRL